MNHLTQLFKLRSETMYKAAQQEYSRSRPLWPSDEYGSAYKKQLWRPLPVPPENNFPGWAQDVWARIKESMVFTKSLVFCNFLMPSIGKNFCQL
jgi:hypothetical protein